MVTRRAHGGDTLGHTRTTVHRQEQDQSTVAVFCSDWRRITKRLMFIFRFTNPERMRGARLGLLELEGSILTAVRRTQGEATLLVHACKSSLIAVSLVHGWNRSRVVWCALPDCGGSPQLLSRVLWIEQGFEVRFTHWAGILGEIPVSLLLDRNTSLKVRDWKTRMRILARQLFIMFHTSTQESSLFWC